VATSPWRKVLVVEDDPQLRDMYRMALRAAGYVVVAVEDGADALRQIEQALPALVVLDLGLPRLGGRDVHSELKARPDTRDIPVVVVTGADMNKIDASDFACILRKPCDADRLVVAVEQCLRRAGGGHLQLS
jgi:two-component system phosphate regulon response regulator PhoB